MIAINFLSNLFLSKQELSRYRVLSFVVKRNFFDNIPLTPLLLSCYHCNIFLIICQELKEKKIKRSGNYHLSSSLNNTFFIFFCFKPILIISCMIVLLFQRFIFFTYIFKHRMHVKTFFYFFSHSNSIF